ncbi:MAG: metal-dependent hydrolase [Mariprofundaceae bacterium]
MDPFTHALGGYAIARAVPRSPLPRACVWRLTLLAMAPDADYVLRLISDMTYLHYHRGVTHSILMLPLWIWLARSLFPRRRASYPLLPWLIGAVILCHIIFDLITSFGTMIFAPVSDVRIAWDMVFIIDPLFSAMLAIPLLLGLWLRRRRRQLAACALAAMGLYLSLTVFNHQRALDITRAQFPKASHVNALPLPFSPFHWQLIASFPDHYMQAAVNLRPGFANTGVFFEPSFTHRFLASMQAYGNPHWARQTVMAEMPGLEELEEVKFFRWFARFPVIMQQDERLIEVGDMRFGAGLWRPYPFSLHIEREPTPSAKLQWNVSKPRS